MTPPKSNTVQRDPMVKIVYEAVDVPSGVMVPIGASFEQARRAMLLATLEHHRGDKQRTAATLGVSLKTVYNLAKEYKRDAVPA